MDDFNYYDTFIQTALDCPVEVGTIPKSRGEARTVPVIQYELLSGHPYRYTQEELYLEVHLAHKGIADLSPDERESIRAALFAKPQACMRASALPKKYGFGLHFNGDGKIALYPMESAEYQRFSQAEEPSVKLLYALRSKRPAKA